MTPHVCSRFRYSVLPLGKVSLLIEFLNHNLRRIYKTYCGDTLGLRLCKVLKTMMALFLSVGTFSNQVRPEEEKVTL